MFPVRVCLVYSNRFSVPPGGRALAPVHPPQNSAFPKAEESSVRFLTPTDNKRLNELIGFLCVTLAVLMALALISYSPRDAAFNVSAPALEGGAARNWIGPVGAYSADLLFQILGFAAFLLPAAILVLGWRWFRNRAVESHCRRSCLCGTFPKCAALCHLADCLAR